MSKVKSKPKKSNGVALLRKAWATINLPRRFDQGTYGLGHSCTSKRCIGGWIVFFADIVVDGHARWRLKGILRISDDVSWWFTSCERTLPQLYAFSMDYVAGKRRFTMSDLTRYEAYRGPVKKRLPMAAVAH